MRIGDLRVGHSTAPATAAVVDFAAIRARMKELRRERERAEAAEIELQGCRALRKAGNDDLLARPCGFRGIGFGALCVGSTR